MQTVYIDDSGNTQPPVYVLAGFGASADKLPAFNRDWRQILDMHPRINTFKMQEASALQGDFANFSERRRDERVNLLCGTILDHLEFGTYAVAHHGIYETVFKGFINRDVDQPRVLNYLAIVQSILAQRGTIDSVRFVFDEQIINAAIRKYWPQFLRAIDPTLAEKILHEPLSMSDEIVPGLQAADLLAWKIRRQWDDTYEKQTKIRWPWHSLDAMPMVTVGLDSVRLKTIRDGVLNAMGRPIPK